MAAKPSLRVIKQFTYRGALREFSNRYHFEGGLPSDASHWFTFASAVATAEKACYLNLAGNGAKIIGYVGYDAGSEIPVYNATVSVDGTGSFANYYAAPGDVAGLVRYATNDRSTKNHPIYLFNYYHAVGISSTGPYPDTWNTAQRTAFQTYAAAWLSGFSDGVHTYTRCGPNGHDAVGSSLPTLVTHRDLPR